MDDHGEPSGLATPQPLGPRRGFGGYTAPILAMKMFYGKPARRNGLSFETFCRFIISVKKGEKAIIHGVDYVVLSRNLYEKLSKERPPKIFIDEAKE